MLLCFLLHFRPHFCLQLCAQVLLTHLAWKLLPSLFLITFLYLFSYSLCAWNDLIAECWGLVNIFTFLSEILVFYCAPHSLIISVSNLSYCTLWFLYIIVWDTPNFTWTLKRLKTGHYWNIQLCCKLRIYGAVVKSSSFALQLQFRDSSSTEYQNVGAQPCGWADHRLDSVSFTTALCCHVTCD